MDNFPQLNGRNDEMHKAIDMRLIRIEQALDRLLAVAEQQGKDLVAQNIILAEHQRRTAASEKRLDLVEEQLLELGRWKVRWQTITTMCASGLALAVAAAGWLKFR